MAQLSKPILRGFEALKGDYLKRKTSNDLTPPIHFISLDDKTKEWKADVADYYENIGLSKVSHSYSEIIKSRHLAVGILDMEDYVKRNPSDKSMFEKAGLSVDSDLEEDHMYDFHPLIPNIVNLLTGYQLKRQTKINFQLADYESKAELFELKDAEFKGALFNIRSKMLQQALYESGLDPENEETQEQFFSEMDAQQQLINKQLEFVNYKDVAVEWANRVHKINYKKHELRNLIKQCFKESYLPSSTVIAHINMMEKDFKVEHIDEAFAFHGVLQNSVNIHDSSYVGWFKWVNIPEILSEFGSKLKDNDISKLKIFNTDISSGLVNTIGFWGNTPNSDEDYDPSRPYEKQYSTLDLAAYRKKLEDTYGIKLNNQTIHHTNVNISPDFKYGEDKLFRIMYLYVNSQKRIGWLRKINRLGEIEYDDYVDENFKVTQEPRYDFSKTKEKTKENLIYGEHIDWEWCNDWRRFIKITPNTHHSTLGSNLQNIECIYLDGDSLKFQFTGSQDSFNPKPPVIGLQVKSRGVKAVSIVNMLKPDQVTFNICKNRIKQVLANDRGLVLAYPTNLISRYNNEEMDDGELIGNYENSIRETKTLPLTYDKQYLQGAGGQMGAPTVLNLSTLNEALQYDQLSEKIWYNALRTIGINPQSIGEVKASEEVSNVQSAQRISQVQTEIIFDEFNSRFIPSLYQKILEATQYYSTINEDFKLSYLNDNTENTWLDITGIDLLHKNIQCYPNYEFDNIEFSEMIKRLAFDNTIQESLVTRLKLISKAEDNPSKVITMLEESEKNSQENAQKMEEFKQNEIKAKIEHEQLLKDKEIEAEAIQKDLDRKSKEYIAQLGLLGGGLQTDSNVNSEIDSYENLKNSLKLKELNQKSSHDNNVLKSKNELDSKMISLKEQELKTKEKLGIMKLKGDLVNRNKSSDKSIENKILGKK